MNKLLQILVAAAVALASAPDSVVANDKKSILVTGASTGIGRNLAETLAGIVLPE